MSSVLAETIFAKMKISGHLHEGEVGRGDLAEKAICLLIDDAQIQTVIQSEQEERSSAAIAEMLRRLKLSRLVVKELLEPVTQYGFRFNVGAREAAEGYMALGASDDEQSDGK